MRLRLFAAALVATSPYAQGHAAPTQTGCEGWRASMEVADERTNKRMGLKLDFDTSTASWDIPPDSGPIAPPRSRGAELQANLHPDFIPLQPMAEFNAAYSRPSSSW